MIGINIVFDNAYAEPALVTAFEIHKSAPSEWALQLSYVYREIPSPDITKLIQDFGCIVLENRRFTSIGICSKSIAELQKFHFNNTVIFKALAPLYCDFDVSITIDCGFISGRLVNEVYDEWLLRASEVLEDTDALLFAYCQEADSNLSASLRMHIHSGRYPIGWVLGLNKQKFFDSNLPTIILNNYDRYHSDLLWPEQDLLCISLSDSQIVAIEGKDKIHTYSLPSCNPCKDHSYPLSNHQDFGLSKIVGSLKPWHRWVLNPKKIGYLKARSQLENILPLETSPCIEESRSLCKYSNIANSFLIEYENHLIRQS